MYYSLTGEIAKIEDDFLVLNISGIGYKLENFSPFRLGLEGQTKTIFIYTFVRETELRLFGFSSEIELQIFELLLAVSGVGPKSAMAIVSQYSPRQIKQAIVSNSPESLKVKGVGKKTLAKMAIELSTKFEKFELKSTGNDESIEDKDNKIIDSKQMKSDSELIEALVGLGYKDSDLVGIEDKISSDSPFAEQIKQALQLLY